MMLEVVAGLNSCIFIYRISMFVVDSGPLITALHSIISTQLLTTGKWNEKYYNSVRNSP